MYLGGELINKTEQQKIKYPGKETKPLPPLPFSWNEILQSNDAINSDLNGE